MFWVADCVMASNGHYQRARSEMPVIVEAFVGRAPLDWVSGWYHGENISSNTLNTSVCVLVSIRPTLLTSRLLSMVRI